MAPPIVIDSDEDITEQLRPKQKTRSTRASPLASSDLSDLPRSPKPKNKNNSKEQVKVEEIIRRQNLGDEDDDHEAIYVCRVKGSQKYVKLKESQLGHVSKMLSKFKKKTRMMTINGSNSDRDEENSAESEESSSSDDIKNFIVEDSDATPKRKRRSTRGSRVAHNTRSTNQQKSTTKNETRRSTRETRHQGKHDFTITIEDAEEEEQDELAFGGTDTHNKVHRTRRSTRNQRDRSFDRTINGSHSPAPQSNRPMKEKPKPTKAKTKLRIGERPRDEHNPKCTKCSGAFEPDLLKNWKKADQQRKGKITARSILHRFPTRDDIYDQGCWVDCLHCTSAYHYGCLPVDIKKDIARQHKQERAQAIIEAERRSDDDDEEVEIPPEKKEQLPDVRLTIKCPLCVKPHGGSCMICRESSSTDQKKSSTHPPASLSVTDKEKLSKAKSIEMDDEEVDQLLEDEEPRTDQPLLFRCTSCNRPAHYLCLPVVAEVSEDDIDGTARYWQTDWMCDDCNLLENIGIEYILAWRKTGPTDSDSNQRVKTTSKTTKTELPNYKDPFEPAEYLCKYDDHSFTDCSWVPHSYMVARHSAKLRNFLTKGPQIDLKQMSGEDSGDDSEDDEDGDGEEEESPFDLEPDHDAESKIPKAWLTPERILSVEFSGEVVIEDMKETKIPQTVEEMYEKIERAYIKWEEQSYASVTWSDKIPKDSPYYPAFIAALERYMKFRKFVVPIVKTETELAKLDAPRAARSFVELKKQPDYIPHQLMNFQLDGVNFCYYNWHRQHPTILSDEMGLGKTVQICSLIAVLTKVEKRMPFLICVPNSTIGNWVRECRKWIPDLKCVPLPGDADSCEVVTEYELFKQSSKAKPYLAAHVVLATYQALEKNAQILRQVQRWEAVIVDEGQRLKAGPKGGLFRALQTLRTGHRILMSGTPLNNNLRELFNLLCFLNPEKYPQDVIDDLEKRYEELTPELIEELRTTIRPYMLRRTKESVLDLPKLTEIIVPISMRPLQKKVYKGLLSKNVAVITAIYGKKKNKTSKASCMNLLMQLRKALAHPYLNDAQIEPSDVTKKQEHDNLVEASGKLVFLQKFIPKLLKRGHRLLIFSQFVIFLDIVERFLDGEGLPFLRLDGSTNQLDRQARIDAFNRPNPTYNIFLLSTRAGGAGINLATADTVIVLDPDYNPHNDLQAVSRAHRFGQKKPVNVFKLMTTASAEERIVQTGKRKLVLDHLVIQKVSEEETEAHDVESILQYGAKELLTASDEALQQDIRYTNEEIDDLIQRTSEESKSNETSDSAKKVDKTFAFARVWEGRSRGLTSMDKVAADEEATNVQEQRSFWDSILQANQEEEQAAAASKETETGRGYRKRREVAYTLPEVDVSPKKRRTGGLDDEEDDLENDEDFKLPDQALESSDSEHVNLVDDDDVVIMPPGHAPNPSDTAMKAAAAEKKTKKRRSIAAATAGMYLQPTAMPSGMSPNPNASFNQSYQLNFQGPGAGFQHVPLGFIEQQANHYHAVSVPRPPEIARIMIPDLNGKSPAEKSRQMDLALRELQQKSRAFRDPELDQILSTVREQSESEQMAIMARGTKLIQKLTKQRNEQNAEDRAQAQARHQAQQQAHLQFQRQAHLYHPQGPPPTNPQTVSLQVLNMPFSVQPTPASSLGHPPQPITLPPPRFKETNPPSIKSIFDKSISTLASSAPPPTKKHKHKNARIFSQSNTTNPKARASTSSISGVTNSQTLSPQPGAPISTMSVSADTHSQTIPTNSRPSISSPSAAAHPQTLSAQGQVSTSNTPTATHSQTTKVKKRPSTSGSTYTTGHPHVTSTEPRPKKDLPTSKGPRGWGNWNKDGSEKRS